METGLATKTLRIVLIDDQHDFLDWAGSTLAEDGGFEIVGSYTEAEPAIAEDRKSNV